MDQDGQIGAFQHGLSNGECWFIVHIKCSGKLHEIRFKGVDKAACEDLEKRLNAAAGSLKKGITPSAAVFYQELVRCFEFRLGKKLCETKEVLFSKDDLEFCLGQANN
jgi:hypothetical protein